MSIQRPSIALSTGATELSEGVSFEPPPEVTRFLARAVLLYGVPFHYLVPDERMLPPEPGSIRFFYIDPGWIATLIQGATSVGRQGERDTVLDTRLRHDALRRALVDAAQVRQKGPACEEPKATATIDGVEMEAANWPLTGFLLRSELVDGWQGVEMRAYSEDNVELAPLRIDRLAPDILLCIFNGTVTRLTVKQPPEGLHFGLSPVGDGTYRRLSLRKVTPTSNGVRAGEQIIDRGTPANPAKPPITAPMRKPRDASRPPTRVLRVADFAKQVAAGLAALGHPVERMTSAELGVELVESPGLADFEKVQHEQRR